VGYDPVALWVNIFTDISPNARYYEAVAFANYHGLLGGYGGGIFGPYDSMTRAMFVVLLHRLEGSSVSGGSHHFADVVSGSWYHNAVMWAADLGLVSGVGGGLFAPHRPITHQEMAVILQRYSAFKGYDIPTNRDALRFTDAATISPWAGSAVQSLSAAGVLNGYNNAFLPFDAVTRAEVAILFSNFIRFVVYANENTNADTNESTPVNVALFHAAPDIDIDRRSLETLERAVMV
jgi:hypothetical protein